MIVYKLVERFDSKTGKRIDDELEIDKVLCDFSGFEGKYAEELGLTYTVDYNSVDPCFGCSGEEYELANKYKFDVYSLFDSPFIFKEYNRGKDKPILTEMLETYKKEVGGPVEFLDQLFRWARVRMVKKLLEEGKYTLKELGLDDEDN